MELEVSTRLNAIYDACLKCLRETGALQDFQNKYSIHTKILQALEAGALNGETRRMVRWASDTYNKEKHASQRS